MPRSTHSLKRLETEKARRKAKQCTRCGNPLDTTESISVCAFHLAQNRAGQKRWNEKQRSIRDQNRESILPSTSSHEMGSNQAAFTGNNGSLPTNVGNYGYWNNSTAQSGHYASPPTSTAGYPNSASYSNDYSFYDHNLQNGLAAQPSYPTVSAPQANSQYISAPYEQTASSYGMAQPVPPTSTFASTGYQQPVSYASVPHSSQPLPSSTSSQYDPAIEWDASTDEFFRHWEWMRQSKWLRGHHCYSID